MHTIVPSKEKQDFIYWFLRNYELKKQESEWILLYISQHQDVLKNVHFIKGAKNCPRGIEMASTCSKKPAFFFYKQQITTTNPDKAYHDLRLNKEEDLFIELNFEDATDYIKYVEVLEDNPYCSTSQRMQAVHRKQAELVLEHIILNRKKAIVKKDVNHALDNKDDETFFKLTEELIQLDSDLKNLHK